MGIAYQVCLALSALLFLYYGVVYAFTDTMAAEFERYGMPGWRRLVGGLQVLGALGLLIGYWYPPLAAAAAAGLTLMMALAVATRVRIRDPLVAMLPAAVLLLVNAYVLYYAVTVAL